MKFILSIIACLFCQFAKAQPPNYYNTQAYENDRRANADRAVEAQNERNRMPNAGSSRMNINYNQAQYDLSKFGKPRNTDARYVSDLERARQRRISDSLYMARVWSGYYDKPTTKVIKNIPGKPADYMEMIFTNGTKTFGIYKNGKLNGPGKILYAEGGSFEGDF